MVVVGIDSMVLIYAGVVPRKAGQPPFPKELTESAKLLLEILAHEEAQIVLPAISISELLVPVPSAKKGELINKLNEYFICRPFDTQAAAVAADIWALHNATKEGDKYQRGERDVLKSDAFILATVKMSGATRFYSNDTKCRKLAEMAGMKACPLPSRDPSSLFTPKQLEGSRKPPEMRFRTRKIKRGDADSSD